MPSSANKVEDPCQECRDRHLKCDDSYPKCTQCEKAGHKCCRNKGARKFRYGSSAKYHEKFAKDQVWLEPSRNAKFQFIEEGPELENFYSTEEPEAKPEPESRSVPREHHRADSSLSLGRSVTSESRTHSPGQPSTVTTELEVRSPTSSTPVSLAAILNKTPNKRRRASDGSRIALERQSSGLSQVLSPPLSEPQRSYVVHDDPLDVSRTAPWQGYASPVEGGLERRKVEAEYRRLADTEAAYIPDEPLLTPSVWKQHFFWPNQFTTTQCACLMRYYTEHLGPWFDVDDPSRHFTSIVPQRARRCPPLLNAIFTAAARHLTYLHKRKTGEQIARYQHISLPDLNTVSMLKYYQATIAYLRVLCNDDQHAQDEDLLAATVILRYYEELQAAITGDSEEHNQLSRPFQRFVAAQAKPAFAATMAYDTYDFARPGAFDTIRLSAESYLKGYQHASFRIALRQECAGALLSREAVQLPLGAWAVLEGTDEADDSVWTDRHLYHYAKVLQFCFSTEIVGRSRSARWRELKDFENRWEERRPLSFSPIHYKEPATQMGEVFPQIWYMNEVHSSGMQYYSLARVLLTAYDPDLPRIGPGSAAARRRVSETARQIVIEICGIATSTLSSQPALVQAYNAIAMFGEHFVETGHQQALLAVLTELETSHGWPTQGTAEALKQEWSW